MGLALFGGGDMTLLSGTQTSLRRGAVAAAAQRAATWPCSCRALGAIGLFVSTLTEQPIGATIAVVLVNLMMFILRRDQPAVLAASVAADPLVDGVRRPAARPDRHRQLERGLMTAAVYAVVFWLLAWARFASKDVTS